MIIFNSSPILTISIICKNLASLLIVFLTFFANPSVANSKYESEDSLEKSFFVTQAKLSQINLGNHQIPFSLQGKYYQKSPKECSDFNLGFECSLTLDVDQLYFGSIATCSVVQVSRKKNNYIFYAQCNNEEAYSSKVSFKVRKTLNGLIVNNVFYKKCAKKDFSDKTIRY